MRTRAALIDQSLARSEIEARLPFLLNSVVALMARYRQTHVYSVWIVRDRGKFDFYIIVRSTRTNSAAQQD